MNKTIIININGTVFHIEEDAYEVLKNYMTEVKRHFMNSADSLEITTDIENRIAEMFNEILSRDGKQALVENDVRAVIEQMGSVQDFEIAEEDDINAPASNAYTYNNTTPRKLFRDADERIIAGVCSGIANYFDANPIWIRLAFATAFVAFGTGLWIYIILWIVVPKAVTRADRMAMKGEKLNLQGFKRNFEEEMNSTQNGIKNFTNQNRPLVYKTRDFAGDFFGYLGNFFKGAGKILVQIIVGSLLLSAIAGLISLIIAVILFVVYDNLNLYNLFPFNIVNYQTNTIYLICGFLLLAIPLITVILLTISALFRRPVLNRSTGFIMLSVWIVTICVVIYYTAKATADFRSQASFSQTVPVTPSSVGTYYLKLNDVKYLSSADSARLNVKDRFKGMTLTEDDNESASFSPGNRIWIDIEKSDVAIPVLVESFSARGRDYEQALNAARAIRYLFVQQDSVLKFARTIKREPGALWRNEELHITLKVPLNTKLVIDHAVNDYISNTIDIWGCNEMNQRDDNLPGTFVMTANGLECLAGPNAKLQEDKADTEAQPADTVIRRTDTIIIRK